MSSLDSRNTNLSHLHPEVRARVIALIAEIERAGLSFELFEAFRSPQRQTYLFTKVPRVTKARAWSSYHQYGLAVDFVLKIDGGWSWRTDGKWNDQWQELHRLGEAVGLEPLSWEKPHLQLKGVSISELRQGEYPIGGDESWADNLEGAIVSWRGKPGAPPAPQIVSRPPTNASGSPFELEDAEDEGEIARSGESGSRHTALLDASLLRDIFPNADGRLLDALARSSHTLDRYGILDDRTRLSYFLAQIAHESGGIAIAEERLSYSAERAAEVFPRYFPTVDSAAPYARNPEKFANKVYANRLGNGPPESGDGWRYRGRGLIQITGRDNYRRIGSAIGLDLEAAPELAASPAHVVEVACGFWDVNDLNRFADRRDFLTLTERINGGTNGLADRKKWLTRIADGLAGRASSAAAGGGQGGEERISFQNASETAMDELAFGDRGERVKALQTALVEAGYTVGAIDGAFGRLTRGAVLQLQADHGLPISGRVSSATWALLEGGASRPVERPRKDATSADLVSKGSTTVKAAENVRLAGLASAILGALGLGNSLLTTVGPKSIATAVPAIPPALADICQRLAQITDASVRTLLQPLCTAGSGSSPVPVALPPRTVLDYLPSLAADPSTQNLLGTLGTIASSFIPGAGGSLLAVGLGVAARYFGNRIVQARVRDHQTAANTSL